MLDISNQYFEIFPCKGSCFITENPKVLHKQGTAERPMYGRKPQSVVTKVIATVLDALACSGIFLW